MKARWCKHYNGFVNNSKCEAGVVYKKFGYDLINTLPCLARNINTNKHCSKREFPTDKEIEKEREDNLKRIEAVDIACGIIREKHKNYKGTKDYGGTIQCPLCNGILHYSVATINGHIWGQCRTDNCLSWMQ